MYIKVRVKPEAKRDTITKLGGTFHVEVKDKAIRNLANNKARELVAGHFGVEPKTIRIISGHRSPSKIFSIHHD